ncbi:hypothetical protein [Paramaledivibacter caminithermalis]|jgi:hypothetical protein|uniref:Uncharacterized protein n=1 Tax=Paramaledivibacter caminithermalis (strain DSM 15212 / CIP 107654 / DViRD3) TaxID=1121301 RepID=A0A1M6TUJ9_PARC5|nr:hypothetical protein [Paramaledivibacter caminithermalis]SHK60609.1 hypothetical protein SAMN02745912_03797 [Paramaledivibacter caminithermalis DSM 15212]
MKINKNKITYLVIFLIAVSLIYYTFNNNRQKELSIENSNEQEDLSVEKTYEIYANNTIYLLTTLDKYIREIQPMIDKNIVSKENSDFIISQFNDIVKTTYDMDFPKPIDENTNQIYNFIKHDLYQILKEMNINIENEIKTNKKSYKNLPKYTNYIRKLTLDNKILDINLNTNTIKSTNLSVSYKDIIIIIAKETAKMKQIMDTVNKG